MEERWRGGQVIRLERSQRQTPSLSLRTDREKHLPKRQSWVSRLYFPGAQHLLAPTQVKAGWLSNHGRLGWGTRGGQRAASYYSYFPTRRGPTLPENLQAQMPQTFIKHLLCTRHPSGHVSCSVPFE